MPGFGNEVNSISSPFSRVRKKKRTQYVLFGPQADLQSDPHQQSFTVCASVSPYVNENPLSALHGPDRATRGGVGLILGNSVGFLEVDRYYRDVQRHPYPRVL
jgi:hypothetical protein